MKVPASILLLLVILFSCNKNADKYYSQPDDTKDIKHKNSQGLTNTEASTDTATNNPLILQGSAPTDWDKKIIKTASLKLEVSDFKKFSSSMYNLVKQSG